MNKLLILIALSLNISYADTTDNLLSQDFTNGWTGTNQSSRHGTSTIAGVDGGNVESTVSLSDTLNASQINGGWTSTLGADMWGWNQYDQEIKMTQTITDANGTVTTQIRDVAIPGCSGYNCGSYSTYTDSYTQGINSQSDYDIAVRFSFDESSNSSGHYATDLKNPTLTIEHSLLDTSQVTELKTMSETVYNTVEDIELIEYKPIENNFESYTEPVIEITMLEEINFEPIAVEEINTGIIDVFMETITYEQDQTIEQDIAFEEEVYEERETDIQTSDASGITEREPIQQETSGRESEEVNGVEDTGGGNGSSPRENEGRITRESRNEDTLVSQEDDTVGERSESDGRGSEDNETLTVRQDSISEERTEETTREDTVSVSIEDIRAEVAKTTASVSQKMVQVNILVAKAMQSPVSIDSYANVNQNIFKDQLVIDGGNYESRDYVDNRNIYTEISYINRDKLYKYQEKIDKAVGDKIKAQLNLERIINGY